MGQSSNDVIPSAIHVSASLEIIEELLPALEHLASIIDSKAQQLSTIVKTGRTHLMDAMPLTVGQELSGWATQIRNAMERIKGSLGRLQELALGATAVGTGINAHPEFGARVAERLSVMTVVEFSSKANYFEALSCQDSAVEMSGQLKTLAVSLMKISNDLRWMNSGPLAGLSEIVLPELQAGSSIMPGKINPVIPEAVAMASAQVIGNDTAITVAGQSGNFQLNVMLPLIAYNLLQSIELMSNSTRVLADKSIRDFAVNHERLAQVLQQNPILVTALNRVIGYEKGAAIAKQAYLEKRSVLDVAIEKTNMSEEDLKALLDPVTLTRGGIVSKK
jgi:fumarate hydratase class II